MRPRLAAGREERAQERARTKASAQVVESAAPRLRMTLPSGEFVPLDADRLATVVRESGRGSTSSATRPCSPKRSADGISLHDLAQAAILAPRTLVETELNYAKVADGVVCPKTGKPR